MAEIAVAAPQVVAHRLTRMALSGPVLSARDRREFTGMVQEKQLAFVQGWVGAWGVLLRLNQSLALSAMRSFWSFTPLHTQARRSQQQVRAAASRMADEMVAPVHRKAVSNARRLAKTRLR